MSTSTPIAANQHKNAVHLEETTYKCRYCNKTFGKICDRDNHEKTVHKAQKCDICFKVVCNLTRHKKNVHFKQKPFECQFCDSIGHLDVANTEQIMKILCTSNESCTNVGFVIRSSDMLVIETSTRRPFI